MQRTRLDLIALHEDDIVNACRLKNAEIRSDASPFALTSNQRRNHG